MHLLIHLGFGDIKLSCLNLDAKGVGSEHHSVFLGIICQIYKAGNDFRLFGQQTLYLKKIMKCCDSCIELRLCLVHNIFELQHLCLVDALVELYGVADLSPGENRLCHRKRELIVHALLTFIEGDVVVLHPVNRCINVVTQIDTYRVYRVCYIASCDSQINRGTVAAFGIAHIKICLYHLFPGLSDIGVSGKH